MKTIKLIFQCYVRQGFDSFNLFLEPVLSNLDSSLKHVVGPVTMIYSPVHPDDVPHEKKIGRMISYAGDAQIPHIVAYQVEVTFISIPTDHREILNNLISLYGKDIVRYEIVEEVYLNDPK